MNSTSARKSGAAVYVDAYWSNLSDEQLEAVTWFTDAPLSLPNIQASIPEHLGDSQIEVEYQLPKDQTAVRCGHCPQHTKHWKGYVLLDSDGKRYLLGSTCGVKAYGSDYRLASSARKRAQKRADALLRWKQRKEDLPDLIGALRDAERDLIFPRKSGRG